MDRSGEGRRPLLESAADLLREDDPGDTPFLVDRLIVDPSILAIVGPPKVGKTWALLELAISIATGTPAFGRLGVRQGPVIVVLEESGRTALHRRLARLCAGRGIAAAQLEHLHFAANRGVQLVGDTWPDQLRRMVVDVEPVAVLLDPLARMKGAAEENSQSELSPVLDLMRELRDLGDCTVGFVQHSGHEGRGRMRGTSDLEAYWESKLTISHKGSACTIRAEHREAEPAEDLIYELAFDETTRSLRLEPIGDRAVGIEGEVLRWLTEHRGSTFDEIRDGISKRKATCRSALDALVGAGTVVSRRSERPDRNEVMRPVDVYEPAPQAGSVSVPDSGTETDLDDPGPTEVPGSHLYRSGTRTGPRVREAV